MFESFPAVQLLLDLNVYISLARVCLLFSFFLFASFGGGNEMFRKMCDMNAVFLLVRFVFSLSLSLSVSLFYLCILE